MKILRIILVTIGFIVFLFVVTIVIKTVQRLPDTFILGQSKIYSMTYFMNYQGRPKVVFFYGKPLSNSDLLFLAGLIPSKEMTLDLHMAFTTEQKLIEKVTIHCIIGF